MNKTNLNLTPEVVDTVSRWQDGDAEGWIGVLQRALQCVLDAGPGDAESLMSLAGELLRFQEEMRVFIPRPKQEGGAQ